MSSKQKKNLIRCIISFILVVALSIAFHIVKAPWWIELPSFLVPYFVVGYDVLLKAFKNIRNGQVFDECFLMTIATVGAIATGEYREGVAVMLFYQIGELFQSIAVGKSRKNIADLMDICPEVANVLHEDGTITEEDPDDVEIGSIIVVNPGEKVPIDGVVISGETSMDTSALTGESVPRMVRTGEQVISGCISLTGKLEVRTEKEFEDSTVSKILELVENSSMHKAKAENFISKFAKYYTPIVCYLALALFLLPPIVRLILGIPADWLDWLMRALTFLVISCPCAVVISVPLSFFGGIGCASSKGILIKGSNYLEVLANVRTIVFDKTGTLTEGVFEVVSVYPEEGITEDYIMEKAAYAENSSNHPIAQSIQKAYKENSEKDVNNSRIDDVKEISGHGVCVKVYAGDDNQGAEGREVITPEHEHIYAGNLKLMERIGLKNITPHEEGTVVYVGLQKCESDDNCVMNEGHDAGHDAVPEYLGCIVISDRIKSTSEKAMKDLGSQGVRTVMLTGDVDKVAKKVAESLGVNTYRAELLPGDKVNEVEKLIEEQGSGGKDAENRNRLAFVGDGINDAPVLARADIGIAMGAMGSDAAIEAADVVLMDDDPAKISLAMKISRKTLSIVKQNITFAIAVKVLCLILGALGIANMWLAIFADVGVMILAVLNATRTLRIK